MRSWQIQGVVLVAACSAGCYGGADAAVDTDEAGETELGDGSSGTGATGESTGGEPEPEDVPEGSVPEPLVPRLNDTQYGYAMEDILGASLSEQERDLIPRDIPVGSKYSTTVQGQFFSAQYVLAYANVARTIVDRVGSDALLQRFGDCSLGDDGCLEAFIDDLGRRTHRRPLTDDQRALYLDLAAAIETDATADDAVIGVAEAMLQSPHFLYRIEDETTGQPGAVYQVDGYELASRLSLFLWQSVPDEGLLDFAAAYDPDDEEALRAEVDRMLADPKFARSRRQFWGDYSLASIAGFSTADPEVREELRESLRATFDHLSGADGPAEDLASLFTGTDLMMTPAVAEIAGAASKGEGMQLYTTDEADTRHGVLSHPAFFAAMGTTSFVGRGVFLTERLLCQHILPPPSDPATADAIMDTAMQTEDLTPREASEFRFGLEPVCLSCHTQFEPVAYAFERYDMVGRYGLTDDAGRALFADGNLPPYLERPEVPFEDAEQLFEGLAELDSTYVCLVENMMQYATGFSAANAEDSVLEGKESFEAEGRTFDALVRAVAENAQVTYKRTAQESP